MKKFIVSLVAFMATATMSFGQSYVSNSNNTGVNIQTTTVRGYTKSDGTYVNGYTHTSRNSTNHNNYSTLGNFNPYTGASGTRARDYSNGAYNYGVGYTIKTGSHGGQYYVNGNGNKCMSLSAAIHLCGKNDTTIE